MTDTETPESPETRTPSTFPGFMGRRVVREALWITGGQAISILAALVGVRALTGLLPPSVFGEVALIAGLATLGRDLACSPLLAGALRLYHDAEAEARTGDLIRVANGVLRRRILMVAAALVALGAVWAAWSGRPELAATFAGGALGVAADSRRNLENNLLNASRRQRAFSVRTAADGVARPCLAVAFVVAFGPHAVAVLAGYAVGTFAVLRAARRWRVLAEASAKTQARETWDAGLVANLTSYGRPLIPFALLGWLISLGDRYFIAGLTSTEAVGLYAAVYGLASQPFLALSGVMTTTLRPLLFDAEARGDGAKERRLVVGWFALIVLGGATGWALLTVLREPITRLLLSRAYWGAAAFIPYLAAAYVFIAVQHLFEAMLFAQGRTRRLLAVQLTGATVALGGYVFLIPRQGALGAAVATMLSAMASCAVAAVMAGVPGRLRRAGRTGGAETMP